MHHRIHPHMRRHEHDERDDQHEHGPPWARHRHPRHWFSPRRGGPFFGGPRRGGPFGDDPFGDDDGPRRRHRRGDIRYALLSLLHEQPRHGYELIKELERRNGGFYRPSPGSVYPTLQLLEDEGHLQSATVDGKRIYTITDSGRALLASWDARQPEAQREASWPGARPELGTLRDGATALMASLMEVARHGTPAQVAAATNLLDATRREVYRILSDDGGASAGPNEQGRSAS